MSLKDVAKETLRILDEARYEAPSGRIVELTRELQAAVDGTVLYTPEQLRRLLKVKTTRTSGPPALEVTDETTQVAAHRLVVKEGCADLALLNFASARNPGGGFINGAKAQEEDLARCSGLYPCLLTQQGYYEVNRCEPSLLYTDHMIYSPQVPWFRTLSRDLLEEVFLASVITAPAPNAGQVLRRNPGSLPQIDETLRRRAGKVLAVARDRGHRTLLLGAWGCGVFQNNPHSVADAFGKWLKSPTFNGTFDRVTFAVFDHTQDRGTLRAFQERLIAS